MNARSGRWLWVLGVGLTARLLVLVLSKGSNDIVLWEGFAQSIDRVGLMSTYVQNPWFNHPPLMGWLAWLAYKAALGLGVPFGWLFKLPAICGDLLALSVMLQARSWSVWHKLLLTLGPWAVLISGHHGNTDGLCVGLSLAAFWALSQRRYVLGPLLLGLALNVKLIPVVLLPVALASVPRARLWQAFLALGAAGLPFLIPLFGAREAFVRNALAYNSIIGPWGFNFFTLSTASDFAGVNRFLMDWFVPGAKNLVMLGSVVWAFVAWRWPRWNIWQRSFVPMGLFLVLAPGFGPQYLIYPGWFLLMAATGVGVEYAVLASAFAFATYAFYWTGSFPALSWFERPWGVSVQGVGLLCWYALGRGLYRVLRAPPSSGDSPPAARADTAAGLAPREAV